LNRKKLLRLLDAEIALAETKLEIFRLEEENEGKMRFAVLFAQKLYLRNNWVDCKECKKDAVIPEACLESRKKTGKCIFEVDFKQLEKLPWTPNKEYVRFVCTDCKSPKAGGS